MKGVARGAKSLVGWMLLLATLAASASASDVKEAYRPLRTFRDCDACSEMIVLPRGGYQMGATEVEFKGRDQYHFLFFNETPRHHVDVESYALAKFSVTKGQFKTFASETNFHGKGCQVFNGKDWVVDANADWKNPGFQQTDSDPVVCVSWDDAQKYISWLNEKLIKTKGAVYRLPTEEEWECAARAGTDTAAYWGDNPQEQCKYENARDVAARALDPTGPYANCNDGYIGTAPVGSFKSNPWGFFDMLGNAEQWVADCVSVGYGPAPVIVAVDSQSCQERRLRGASWSSIPIGVRSAVRSGMTPNSRESIFGFRLAAGLPK